MSSTHPSTTEDKNTLKAGYCRMEVLRQAFTALSFTHLSTSLFHVFISFPVHTIIHSRMYTEITWALEGFVLVKH